MKLKTMFCGCLIVSLAACSNEEVLIGSENFNEESDVYFNVVLSTSTE